MPHGPRLPVLVLLAAWRPSPGSCSGIIRTGPAGKAPAPFGAPNPAPLSSADIAPTSVLPPPTDTPAVAPSAPAPAPAAALPPAADGPAEAARPAEPPAVAESQAVREELAPILDPSASPGAKAAGLERLYSGAVVDRLAGEMSKVLLVDDYIGRRDLDNLKQTVRRLIASPTAHASAEEFVRLRRPVGVGFYFPEGSRIVAEHGRKRINGPTGSMSTAYAPPQIRVHAGFVETDPTFSAAAEALGHELLGHADAYLRVDAYPQAQRIKLKNALPLHWHDELRATLLSWVIAAELGYRFDSTPYMWDYQWSYLESPAALMRHFSTMYPVYAQLLTRQEASDPAPVYQERIKRAEEDIAGFERTMKDIDSLKEAARRLQGKPGFPRSAFEDIFPHLDARKAFLQTRREMTRKAIGALRSRINRIDSAWASSLREAFAHPFFLGLEEQTLALTDRLRALTAGLRREDGPPDFVFRPGQITENELRRLRDEKRD